MKRTVITINLIIMVLAIHLTASAQVPQPDLKYFPLYPDNCDRVSYYTSQLDYKRFNELNKRTRGCELDEPLHVEDQSGSDRFNLDVENRGVHGSASIHSIQNKGGGIATHSRDIYADVVPGATVKVDIQYSLMAYAEYVPQQSWEGQLVHGAGISFRDTAYSVENATWSKPGVLSTYISPSLSSSSKTINGKTYYQLGTLGLSGKISGGGADYRFGVGAFSAQVTDIQAYYNGNVITKADGNNGDNQTWLVGQELPAPISVKVSYGVTGAAVPDKDITFTLQYPDNTTIPLGTAKTDANGIANKKVTLGGAPGIYKVIASCPASVCVAGVRDVVFTAAGKTNNEVTKLTEMFCDGAHFYSQKLSNPLRVRALNLYTNKGEKGLAVTFLPKEGSPRGAIHTENTTTNSEGIAGTDFTLGNELKTHAVVAHCAQCLAGQTVECLVRSMYPPNANHKNPGVGIDKRKRGVSIALSPEEVYPQGTGAPVESIVTISGANTGTAFTAQVVAGANTGGHQHHDPNRPKGALSGHGSTTCTGTSPITCTTSANGGAQLRYVSNAVGGWDTILVKMVTGEEGDAIVKVRVPGVITLPLPNANYYEESNDGNHPNHYYGREELISGIDKIAKEYMRQYNAQISVNDMSLINGGVFDVKSNWFPNPHVCHKSGMSVDFNRKHREGRTVIKVINMGRRLAEISSRSGADCRRIVEKMVGGKCFIHFECPSSSACEGEVGASCQEVCPEKLPENTICAGE